jgi:hypothetical protein
VRDSNIGIKKKIAGWNKGLKQKDYLTAEVINKLKEEPI